jgi:hypothetical protein
MLKLIIIACAALTSISAAQSARAQKPLGTWDVEYERGVQQHMVHTPGEATRVRERGRMTLRAVGDSLFGDIALSDADSTKLLLRGTARSDKWALYVEEARPSGLAVLMVPIDAAIEWIKENVHGMQPVVVRFDLAARSDSLQGTRTVTGGIASQARTSVVRGSRRKP